MRCVFIFILVSISWFGCNTGPEPVNCDFDEQAMLVHYADDIIIPRLETLDIGLTLLESSVQLFISNPSVDLLNEVRITYLATYGQYQEASVFGFGPGMVLGAPFRERFNTFPTNASTIESNVQSSTEVASSPRSSVGFPALDYLLFGMPGSTVEQVLAAFTTDPNASSRRNYLLGLVSEMHATSSSIVTGWKPEEGNFRQQFIENTGTAEGSSISLLMNEFNFEFETLKNFKFKIPLGKYNGGVVLPHQVEGYYSGYSAALAIRQCTAFKDFYQGIGGNGVNDLGFDDYLVCLQTKRPNGNLLADAIVGQFEAILSCLNAIPAPMSDALVSNKPLVDAAYLKMQEMVPMIKYEMTSALAVQINYQDNDGD